MTKKSTNPTIQDLITTGIDEQLAKSGYREPAMLALRLREMLGENPDWVALGITVEREGEIPKLVDEQNTESQLRESLLRVSSESEPYLQDLHRALVLERWCDEAVKCPPQDLAKEFTRMWPDVTAWREHLAGTKTAMGLTSRTGCEGRLAAVLVPVVPLIEFGGDYLFVLWSWLREPAATTNGQGPRLAQVVDLALIERLCTACLDHDLVSYGEIDAVLQAVGCSPVRVRLAKRVGTSSPGGRPDDLLTPEQAATLLGITVGAFNNKKSQGQIPASVYVAKKGQHIKYRREALLKWHRGELG